MRIYPLIDLQGAMKLFDAVVVREGVRRHELSVSKDTQRLHVMIVTRSQVVNHKKSTQ